MVARFRESFVRFGYVRHVRYVKGLGIGLTGLGLVLLWGRPGWSHGAIATVTQTFSVEAHYASGEPMALAQVVVYSPEHPDAPWMTGQTNQDGKFDFNPDAAGNWDVVIRQAGHGTTVSVPVATSALTQRGRSKAAQPSAVAPTAALVSSSDPSAHPLHRWASAGAALWGLIGTVLFFSRGKRS